MNMTGWDILITAILNLLAVVIAVTVTLWIERLRRPVFDLMIEDYKPGQHCVYTVQPLPELPGRLLVHQTPAHFLN